MPNDDVVAAIATAPGRAGIGVVRVSGKNLQGLARQVTGKTLQPRHATLAEFRDRLGEIIDQGIALFFPAPHSYTGEDVLELHAHGGDTVLRLLLTRCLELGASAAQPGEFTKRAFLNGKLDLAQAESVADLIESATAAAAKSAVRSLTGEFSRQIDRMAQMLVDLRVRIEAALDFPEEDIDAIERSHAGNTLNQVRYLLQQTLASASQGALLRSGLNVVLLGRPNVGKSSLLNRLAGAERAIVTPFPGTTRDTVQERIEIEGVALQLVDTAGLRSTEDDIERLGMDRTRKAAREADLALLIAEAPIGVTDEDRALASQLDPALPLLWVHNKVDLIERDAATQALGSAKEVYVSAKTGAGLDALRREILESMGWKPGGEGVFMARARHVEALRAASDHLDAAVERINQPELFSEELRLAHEDLLAITGAFTPDDLLGEIFSRFCIGK